MPLPDVIDNPTTLADLTANLERIHMESAAFWNAFPDPAFFAPIGEHWSPADHIRHLNKSMRPVARAMRLPRLVLRLIFPTPKHPSRDYDTLRQDYHAVLAAGGQAGSYAPAPVPPEKHNAQYRSRLMQLHAQSTAELVTAIRGWRDEALDQATLPHPLLGPLTLREMVQFMLYHNLHHVHVAERRRGEAPA